MAASRFLRLHSNYDKEASIRKTSVSLPVKLSCVTAWLEQPCLLLVFSGKEVSLLCLSNYENDCGHPFQLEEDGIL